MRMAVIGKVTHYFAKIGVAVIELSAPLAVGDHIRITGHTDEVAQRVDSMQIEHESVQKADAGQSVGLKAASRVHESDIVHKEE